MDRIRAELGPNIPLGVVHGLSKELKHHYFEAYVTEDFARKSGLFKDRHKVEVEVPIKSLNKYVTEKVGYDNDGESTTAAWIYNTVDVGNLLYDWKEAGYPLKWYPISN